MTIMDEGKTVFLDGMRVTKEHMDHLQGNLLSAVHYLRQTLAVGKVCYGFKVQATGADKLTVGPGLAFDAQARPLVNVQEREVSLDPVSADPRFLVAVYALRAEGIVNGTPTLLFNSRYPRA